MTLYTYHCHKCGQFSEFRKENDRKYCKCGQRVTKVYGGAFKLVGKGFYSTDNKST